MCNELADFGDMDKKAHSTTDTGFNRLNPANHLKPLSRHSRMITCEQNASLNHQKNSNPFVNLKIEIVNNCVKKRNLEDSRADGGYETPAKKACSQKDLSPDQGCVMDFCSPPAKQESPFAISMPTLLDETEDIKSEIKDSVSSEPGVNTETVPHSMRCEKFAPDFDCDVDDILCLNPFGNAAGFSDNVESCKSPSGNTFLTEPVLNPTVAQGKELERGDGQKLERGGGQVKEGQEELEKEIHLNVNDVEEDKGYFSMSYIKDLKMGKNPSQSVDSQLPPASSSPLLRKGEIEAPEKACPPSPEPGCSEQTALSGQDASFIVCDVWPIVSGSLLESDDRPVEPLEGDVKEAWNIGSPIFESSVCQATPDGEETTLDTSYETTLPLQVQVKSVVVVVGQHASSSKTAAPSLPEQTTKPSPDENRGVRARSERPVVFDREEDWQREKRLYVNSVTRHMKQNRGANQDAMSELMTLMTNVADQTPGTDGKQWQHPSDLTHRNYQRRLGNQMPKMTLLEWLAKNCAAHKRFAKVPNIFERTPFP